MVLASPSTDGGEGVVTKKKLALEKSDGRRLVEYLVVVSSLSREVPSSDDDNDNDGKKKESDNNNNGDQWKLSTSFDDEDIEIVHAGFNPVITARYPQYDHEDNPFDENVSYFCHTSGSIELKKEPFMPKVCTSTNYKQVHCFVLT
jgi:hypothetical protein